MTPNNVGRSLRGINVVGCGMAERLARNNSLCHPLLVAYASRRPSSARRRSPSPAAEMSERGDESDRRISSSFGCGSGQRARKAGVLSNRRVIFTGGPGAGKTTLLDALAGHGYACVHDSARAIIQDRLRRGLSARPDPAEFATVTLRMASSGIDKLPRRPTSCSSIGRFRMRCAC